MLFDDGDGFLRQSDEILSVAEFSRRFKTLIKARVPELWLRGEISNLKTYASGHTYFTLKDADASISAVLFKGYSRSISFPLREGMKILIYGEITVYEARGSYQILVKAAMPDGEGDLAKRFELLKKKLADEGLFDKSRKREIPAMPRRIAVITSPTGAALRDFCRILLRRGWRGEVCVLPSRVQGAEAAGEIVGQLKFAQNAPQKFDLIVVMRGGGSLEDLWSFNEESVARAVAASSIPVISAVGHEIDFTLSDFAADLRAETPSAAAEYISSNFIALENSLSRVYELIGKAVSRRVSEARAGVERAEDLLRLNSPMSKIANLQIRLDDILQRLISSSEKSLARARLALSRADGRFAAANPSRRIPVLRAKLDSLAARLDAVDTMKILSRGFAIVKTADGKPARAAELSSGDTVSITLADGRKSASIK